MPYWGKSGEIVKPLN